MKLLIAVLVSLALLPLPLSPILGSPGADDPSLSSDLSYMGEFGDDVVADLSLDSPTPSSQETGFIRNMGQLERDDIRYYTRGDFRLGFSPDRITYLITEADNSTQRSWLR